MHANGNGSLAVYPKQSRVIKYGLEGDHTPTQSQACGSKCFNGKHFITCTKRKHVTSCHQGRMDSSYYMHCITLRIQHSKQRFFVILRFCLPMSSPSRSWWDKGRKHVVISRTTREVYQNRALRRHHPARKKSPETLERRQYRFRTLLAMGANGRLD